MAQVNEFELVVLVDSNGDYSVGKDEADVREKYEEQIQALSEADGFRMVRVTLSVPLPEIVDLTGTVPEDASVPALLAVK